MKKKRPVIFQSIDFYLWGIKSHSTASLFALCEINTEKQTNPLCAFFFILKTLLLSQWQQEDARGKQRRPGDVQLGNEKLRWRPICIQIGACIFIYISKCKALCAAYWREPSMLSAFDIIARQDLTGRKWLRQDKTNNQRLWAHWPIL